MDLYDIEQQATFAVLTRYGLLTKEAGALTDMGAWARRGISGPLAALALRAAPLAGTAALGAGGVRSGIAASHQQDAAWTRSLKDHYGVHRSTMEHAMQQGNTPALHDLDKSLAQHNQFASNKPAPSPMSNATPIATLEGHKFPRW